MDKNIVAKTLVQMAAELKNYGSYDEIYSEAVAIACQSVLNDSNQDTLFRGKDKDEQISILKATIRILEYDKEELMKVVLDKSEFHATKDAMRIAELEEQVKQLKKIHAHWEITGANRATCSNCGYDLCFAIGIDKELLKEDYKYCSKCGAIMDE